MNYHSITHDLQTQEYNMQTIRFRRHLLAILLTLALPRLACAEISTAAIVQDMHWRLVGPFRGGRTRAVRGCRASRTPF